MSVLGIHNSGSFTVTVDDDVHEGGEDVESDVVEGRSEEMVALRLREALAELLEVEGVVAVRSALVAEGATTESVVELVQVDVKSVGG